MRELHRSKKLTFAKRKHLLESFHKDLVRKSLADHPAAETVQKGKDGENLKLAHAKHKHNAKKKKKKTMSTGEITWPG